MARPSLHDIAKDLLDLTIPASMYDVGLHEFEPFLKALKEGQRILYVPFLSQSWLAHYLNKVYTYSTEFWYDFIELLHLVIGTYWYRESNHDIIARLEMWVIHEIETLKMNKMKEQWERIIRNSLRLQ